MDNELEKSYIKRIEALEENGKALKKLNSSLKEYIKLLKD